MPVLDPAATFRRARALRLHARGLRYLATHLCHRCADDCERSWATRELARLDRLERAANVAMIRRLSPCR